MSSDPPLEESGWENIDRAAFQILMALKQLNKEEREIVLSGIKDGSLSYTG